MYEDELRVARRGKVVLSGLLLGIVVTWVAVAWWSLQRETETPAEAGPPIDPAVGVQPPEVPELTEEPLEEPVLCDSEGSDPGEDEVLPEDSDPAALEEEPNFLSDSPFDGTNLNDVIGIGGGSGGKYGGRFAGRRNLRAAGRSSPEQSIKVGSGNWADEKYQAYATDGFRRADEHPLSTFSIDVDSASYTNARRMLDDGVLPLPAAVRVEEFINYFRYDYAQPEGELPLALDVEVAACPWRREHRLVRVALASRAQDEGVRQPRNLVFLIDVSGSMKDADKLPLVKRGLKLLVGELDERDSISIVTYAAGTRVALEPTRGDQKQRILAALDDLTAGGSTNGAGGIQLAYGCAARSFLDGGVNRVLLSTDGDFNVGLRSREALVALIQEKAASGVFLTVLGFGEGNLKDATLEQLADKGNGHYLYVDSLREARRVFVEQTGRNLVTVAKDVKLQVEFNPSEVASYRLVGYANRKLAARDFNDDGIDAGEVGAGHAVTAFYEVVPTEISSQAGVDSLRYQQPRLEPTAAARSGELLTVKLRYKLPDETESRLLSRTAVDRGSEGESSNPDFRFASAVALFGELLMESPHVADHDFADVLALLEGAVQDDPSGQRTEFFDLVLRAMEL